MEVLVATFANLVLYNAQRLKPAITGEKVHHLYRSLSLFGREDDTDLHGL
jgi:hypothetical protein